MAINSRRRLRRYKKKAPQIHDDRLPPRASGVFGTFVKARFQTLDVPSAKEGLRTLSQEWKNLSPAERRPFEDVASAEATKYKHDISGIKAKAEKIETEARAAEKAGEEAKVIARRAAAAAKRAQL